MSNENIKKNRKNKETKISKIKNYLQILILISLLFYSIIFYSNYFKSDIISSFTGKNFNFLGNEIKFNLNENISGFNVYFCPQDNCYNVFLKNFQSAKSLIDCAFFDLNLQNLSEVLRTESLKKVNVSIMIDDFYKNNKNLKLFKNSTIFLMNDENRKTKYDNFMHDKFCIIDNKTVITGSANPTFRGFYKNNNNILEISSKLLAKDYLNEFNQMEKGNFGYNKKNILEYENLSLNLNNNKYKIFVYFCPENNCIKHILFFLNKAKSSVYFASFILTDKQITDKLINLSKNGIIIKGIVEKRNFLSKYSTVDYLLKNNISVFRDGNKYTMHNKYFIIDNKYVITGSMNPTISGARYNDENIIIIRNKNITTKFLNNFFILLNQSYRT